MNAPVAAIDIGTNTVLCLVARAGVDGELEVLDDACATARLGAGLARHGTLDDAAIERAIAILARQLGGARELGAARVRAVGTAVLRRAADTRRFLDACRDRLGLEVEVLSEEDEARIGHRAVAGEAGADTIVIDVGGGSTEVVTDAGARCLSAPIGALVLSERYLGLDGSPPTADGGPSGLVAEVTEACRLFPARGATGREVVLLGGTAANLACLEAGGARFDPARAEGRVLPADAAERWAARLLELSPAQRAALPIEADRAQILPAGLACLAGALGRLDAARARVTGRGLRHGVARALLGDQSGAPPGR